MLRLSSQRAVRRLPWAAPRIAFSSTGEQKGPVQDITSFLDPANPPRLRPEHYKLLPSDFFDPQQLQNFIRFAEQELAVEHSVLPATTETPNDRLPVDVDRLMWPSDQRTVWSRPPKGECFFCSHKSGDNPTYDMHHLNIELLHQFINERGMIRSRRITNNCAKHQRKLAVKIKRARVLGLLSAVSAWKVPLEFRHKEGAALRGRSLDIVHAARPPQPPPPPPSTPSIKAATAEDGSFNLEAWMSSELSTEEDGGIDDLIQGGRSVVLEKREAFKERDRAKVTAKPTAAEKAQREKLLLKPGSRAKLAAREEREKAEESAPDNTLPPTEEELEDQAEDEREFGGPVGPEKAPRGSLGSPRKKKT